jgi:hypothetical protein
MARKGSRTTTGALSATPLTDEYMRSGQWKRI